MKKLLVVFLAVCTTASYAQKKALPEIKQGSKLHYLLSTNEGAIPLVIKIDSIASDYVRFGWMMENQTSGTWIMKKQSIESSTGGYWRDLQANMAVELESSENVVFFSKAQWAALQKDKKVTHDMKSYSLKTAGDKQQITINGSLVDALYMETDDGSGKIWILNNPNMPVLLKIEGNSAGPNAELKSID